MPTLGIKGKKISKKERYLETIDPAPSTPAGEPLGEIEVEVSAETAERLKKGWSIEVEKAETETTPVALLETSYPKKLEKKSTPTDKATTQEPTGPRVFSSPHCPVKDTASETLTPNSPSTTLPVADTPTSTPSEPLSPTPPSPAMDRNVHSPAEAPPSILGSRTFAALIDFSIACSFFVLGLLLFPDPPRIIPFVLGGLYLLTKDSLRILNGQSIGKKLMRLRVVKKGHRTLTGNYKASLKRNLSWLVAPIEFAILYVREDEPNKGHRLGDDWAGTQVIPETKNTSRMSKWLP